MAFVPVTSGARPSFGRATWYPVKVKSSLLCTSPGGCSVVTANTVYDNKVMGLYVRAGVTLGSYLATISHHGADGRES